MLTLDDDPPLLDTSVDRPVLAIADKDGDDDEKFEGNRLRKTKKQASPRKPTVRKRPAARLHAHDGGDGGEAHDGGAVATTAALLHAQDGPRAQEAEFGGGDGDGEALGPPKAKDKEIPETSAQGRAQESQEEEEAILMPSLRRVRRGTGARLKSSMKSGKG